MENLQDHARRIEFVNARPLNGSSWERVLDTREPECWRFRLSKKIFLPFLFIFFPLTVVFSCINLLAAGIILFLLLLIIFTVKRLSAVPTFDFDKKCFYCDRKKPRYGDVSHLKGYLPFSKISGVQFLYKTVNGSKGQTFQRYELNLIKDDLNRVFVSSGGNYNNMLKAAEMLAEKLNVPLKINNKNQITSKPVPAWVAFLFLIFFSGMGSLGLTLNIIQPLWKNLRSQEWKEADAEVCASQLSSSSRRSKNGSYTVYKADITYQYSVNGKKYSSSNYSFFHDFSQNLRKHRELVRNYPAGKKISCYFNPKDPYQAIIVKEFPSPGLILVEAGGYFVFIAAGVGIFFLLRSQRKKDQHLP